MAINKRKILQSAQKHLQKGALDKALKDYQTLLKADPRDANLRLKIGDIELKRGKTDEAIAAYMKVAEAFMKDGFDAKAVALYKQIAKIDPKRVDVLVPLADLYQRMGLASDAMGALQTAADAHYRDGRKDEALDLLRRMCTLDPSNTNSRLKVADLLRQEERNEEAIAEYEEVVAELERQGAEEDRIRVLVRVLELDPNRVDLMASVARSRIDSGNFEAAEKTANMMIEQQPDDPDAWLLLGEARGGLRRGEESVEAYRRAAELHRERGNDDVARDITQRFVAPAGGHETAEDDLLGAAIDDLGACEAPDPGFDPNGMSLGSPLGGGDEPIAADEAEPQGEDHSTGEGASLPPLPQVDATPVPEAPRVDGDPEQLLAEASVYLRYGKHDRAIESLRAIVSQDPTRCAAFAKLGEALEATGQTEHAITAYERGAQAARQNADTDAFEELRARLALLDPDRAQALEDLEASSASPEPAGEPGAEEIDIDLDAEIEVEAADTGPLPEASDEVAPLTDETPAPSAEELSSSDEIEIELGLDDDSEPLATTDEAPAAEADDEIVEDLDLSGEVEVAFDDASGDAAEQATDEIEVELAADVEPAPSAVEDPEEAPADDEAEIDDGLMDVAVEGADDLAIEISDPDLDQVFEDDDDEAGEVAEPVVALQSPEEAAGASASATTPSQLAEDLEEADFFFQQGMLAEAKEIYERILAAAPSHPQALLRVGEIEVADAGEAAGADAGAEVSPESAAEPVDLASDDLFDDLSADGDTAEAEADEDEESTDGLGAARGDESLDADAAEDDTGPIGVAEPEVADESEAAEEPDAAGALEATDAAAEAHADAEPDEDDAFEAADESDDEGDDVGAMPGSTIPAEAEITAPVGFAAASPDDGFDLAAQLSDAFDLDEGGAAPLAAGTEGEGFEEVFAAFKQGVQNALEDADYEAHHDLGIAYKEMGLLDDAIGEFRAAMGGDERKLACLHMMGLCAFDLGRMVDAVAHLEQALAMPDVPEEQQVGFRFDLGRAYAGAGDVPRARKAFEAVQELDPEFLDVGEQLAALDEAPPPADEEDTSDAAVADETFENFDDLMADGSVDADAEPDEGAAPAYESFDDLMADDEDEEDDGEGEDEAAPAEPVAPMELAEPAESPESAEPAEPAESLDATDSEPAAEPEASEEPVAERGPEPDPPKKKSRRKKKISFV